MKDNYSNYDILYVDDEKIALKYFHKAFSKKFSVVTCDNVSDGKNILDEKHDSIAVLISDQRMPNAKGTSLLSYTLEHYPHIVRILTTAYSDLQDTIDAVNDGEIFRYVSKPWDIQSLTADLTSALRFFMLRRDHDQLLREKLNVKQRMLELNRVRDLIIMASAFTHTNNPLHAIVAFLLQVPVDKNPRLAELESLDIWGLLEKEINTQLRTSADVIRSAQENKRDFQTSEIALILENVKVKSGKPVDIQGITSSSIKCNATLIENMFLDLLKTVTGDVTFIVEQENERIRIIMDCGVDIIHDTSLLHVSSGLLNVFFVSYHHNGQARISRSRVKIWLPSDPQRYPLPALEDDWLERILFRFEDWPD